MVDSVETKESKMFRGQGEQFAEFQDDRIALYYFWCKQKVLVQAEELFDVIDICDKKHKWNQSSL